MVAAFYKFVPLSDFEDLRGPLQRRCASLGLLGTILLAAEGINGTVSGSETSVLRFFERLKMDARFRDLHYKSSWVKDAPFYRMKVRLKKEIVSMGVDGIDPNRQVGEYVPPEGWNALVARPDVRLIDTRNDYEVHLGTFEGAVNPQIRSFRQFPEWLRENLDPEKDLHVAMFCTGGIRCEKSTSYLIQQGFKNVYQLDGGILNYLESVDPADSTWQGNCFVFDNRVTVDHALMEGNFEVCPACRMPLGGQDRESPMFELHVSCPKCFHRLTPEKRQGLLERARQIELAAQRAERHLGTR